MNAGKYLAPRDLKSEMQLSWVSIKVNVDFFSNSVTDSQLLLVLYVRQSGCTSARKSFQGPQLQDC